ncbi:MAG: adenylate kinase [Bacteroidales bacterium]|jgi:adenylate kinase|nr:adenylate kinase [Bacteroidales bacterium]
MLNIVIFGAPGSGKGTQSDKIIEEYGVAHISTGDVLRAEIKKGTELGKLAASYIDEGNFIPDSLMIKILAAVLDALGKDIKGVIFDGFPRTIPQALALDEMLADRDEEISTVIGLEVDDAELIHRIVLRGRTSGRADDNEHTARHRLENYHHMTQPLKKYYIDEGKYVSISGVGDIDEIFSHIKKAIDAVK